MPVTIPGLRATPTTHSALLEWVAEIAALTQPDRVYWCDGSRGRVRPAAPRAGRRAARSSGSTRRSGPNSFLARSRPRRRRARRGPHLHLLASTRRTPARPTTGSTRTRCARRSSGLFDGCMRGRTMYVVPVLHGPARVADLARSASRSPTRPTSSVIDAHHDPHGQGGARRSSATDGVFVPAVHCVGAPLAARPGRRRRGRATPTKYIVHFPETREIWSLRLRLRRQRAARQEVLRAAHRLGHGARRGLARRAHADPQARPRPTGDVTTSPPPSRAPAARPTSRCCADHPGLEGRDRRRRHRLDALRRRRPALRRSTPRPASSASRPAPAGRPTRTPSTRCTATRSSRTSRCTDDGDVWWEGLTDDAARRT